MDDVATETRKFPNKRQLLQKNNWKLIHKGDKINFHAHLIYKCNNSKHISYIEIIKLKLLLGIYNLNI